MTSGGDQHQIVWVFGDLVINRTFDVQKHALANGSLYIEEVQGERDRGAYRCCSENVTGVLCSQEAFLYIAGKSECLVCN